MHPALASEKVLSPESLSQVRVRVLSCEGRKEEAERAELLSVLPAFFRPPLCERGTGTPGIALKKVGTF